MLLYVRFLLSFLSQKGFCRTCRFQLKKKSFYSSTSTSFDNVQLTLDLVETASSQIVCNDHVCHGVEDKLYVLSVSGAGHVTVDLLGGRLVLRLELSLDVGCCLSVLLGA